MQLFSQISPLRKLVSQYRSKAERIALVPTMGALHPGHLSLVTRAKELGTKTAVSIFVNPTQFNNPLDLERYPRDLKNDLELLQNEKVDFVFAPQEDEIYGENFQNWVTPSVLADPLEGQHRPGHFRGVATVVSVLFNTIEPDFAVFGEKDFQQLRVIEQLVEDLKFSVQIARVPTVREGDGLALSSRNSRLTADERKAATLINRALFAAKDSYKNGESSAQALKNTATAVMKESPLNKIDYVEITDSTTLGPLEKVHTGSRILAAVKCGQVRLIDNVEL